MEKKKNALKRISLLIISLCLTGIAHATNINLPVSIWKNCRNGVDSLNALAEFHKTYIFKDVTIVYPARKTIHITITPGAPTIWLSHRTDFNGCTLVVRNNSKDHLLFALAWPDATAKDTPVGPKAIDSGDFSQNPSLSKGNKMVVVEDKTPWVSQRQGYGTSAIRRDIMIIRDGKAQGTVTAPYQTPSTSILSKAMNISESEKSFQNLTLKRASGSTRVTNLLAVSLENNVIIKNINIITPNNHKNKPKEGDRAISIANSAQVLLSDITIQGTYSDYNKVGYGIALENIRDCTICRLKAVAHWGVFGNNNINNITLEDCDINRFDIHCYGRDITFHNCIFRNELDDINTYNQFSSVFGTILFENCRFLHFYPVLHESSYNAYTGYNLVMRNCYMELDGNHNCIISAGKLENSTNSRPELKEKCWPNITIDGLTLKTNGIADFYLFKPMGGNNYSKKLEHLSDISIRNVSLIPSGTILQFHESPFKVRTKQRLKRAYSFPSNIRLQKRIK